MILIHIIFTLISTLRYICDLFIYLCCHDLFFIKLLTINILSYILFKYILFKKYKLSTIRKEKYQAYLQYKINDNNIQYLVKELSFIDFFVNIALIFLVIVFYIIIVALFFFFNKISFFPDILLCISFFYNKYLLCMLSGQNYLRLNYYTREFRLFYLVKMLKNVSTMKHFFSVHIEGLQFIIHRVFFLLIIIYDMIYNDMILSHIYLNFYL